MIVIPDSQGIGVCGIEEGSIQAGIRHRAVPGRAVPAEAEVLWSIPDGFTDSGRNIIVPQIGK